MKSIVKMIGMASCCLLITNQGMANVDVELNPGYIEGQVTLGTLELSSGTVTARSTEHFAQTSIQAGKDYNLTVQVEKDSTDEYSVSSRVLSSEGHTLDFPKKTVTVADGQTSQLNLGSDNPARIIGDVIVPDDFPLPVTRIAFDAYMGDGGRIQKHFNSPTEYEIPYFPGENGRMYAYIFLQGGIRLTQYFGDLSPAEGETLVRDIVLDSDQVNIGYMTLAIAFSGEREVTRFDCSGLGTPVTIYPNGTNKGSYTSGPIQAGNKYISCSARFANGNWVLLPEKYYTGGSKNFIVEKGETTAITVNAEQAYVDGKIQLSGAMDNNSIDTLSNSWAGINLGIDGVSAGSRVIPAADGELSFVVTPDNWILTNMRFAVNAGDFTPEYFSSQNFEFARFNVDLEDTAIAPGETQILPDINLKLGSVTVKFRVADGSPLSVPYLSIHRLGCVSGDGVEYGFSTSSKPQHNVTEGYATFVGPQATCTGVRAWANVNGSVTSFGEFDINVVPGVDQQIDIDGPRIAVDVEPDSVFDHNNITVTGTATDDSAVTSVRVNGQEATVISTNNPDDPNEVSFEVEVELQPGENILTTVAFDDSDNFSSDLRRVVYQLPAPEIYIQSPADGAQVENRADFEVYGVIRAGSELVSLTLNDMPINPHPRDDEYVFADDLVPAECVQYPCEMDITVMATDSSGATGESTITIILVEEIVPVRSCDANRDGAVDKLDIAEIFKARNTTVEPFDPRDFNGDLIINVSDARGCQLSCDQPRCAIAQ